jgi:tetratricopeptide (TPR) repeat protein
MDLKDSDAIGEFNARFPHCPEPALLQAAQSGVLPEEAGAAVKAHMDMCTACSSLVRDLTELDDAPLEPTERERIWGMIRAGIAAEESAAKPAAPPWWKLLLRPAPVAAAAAAAVLLAIGAGLLRNPQPPPVVATSRSPQPAAAAPPAVSVLRPDKAPILLPASAVLVWRGDSGAANTQGKELREALIPYEADQYDEAAQRLEGLSKKYPRLAEAQFYLGVSRLFLERNGDAAASLESARALAGPALRDQASWYLALAYHRTGRDSDARPLLEPLCRAAGANSERACSALKELHLVQ